MTIEQLRERVASEQKTLGKLRARKQKIEEHQARLRDEVAYYDKQMLGNHRAENAADVRVRAAQGDLEEAQARAIAEAHNGLSREELMSELKHVLKSKLPFEHSVIRLLEIYTRYQGIGMDELGYVIACQNPAQPNRYRTMVTNQRYRVLGVLDAHCPKHPESGRYLPPYVAEVDRIVGEPDVAPPVGINMVPSGYSEPSAE